MVNIRSELDILVIGQFKFNNKNGVGMKVINVQKIMQVKGWGEDDKLDMWVKTIVPLGRETEICGIVL